MKFSLRPGSQLFVSATLSREGFRRLVVVVLIVWLLVAIGLYLLAEAAATR